MARKAKNKLPKMSRVGREVLEGLNETLDFVLGKPTEGNVLFMCNGKTVGMKEICAKLGLSSGEFAKAFSFKNKTIKTGENKFVRLESICFE